MNYRSKVPDYTRDVLTVAEASHVTGRHRKTIEHACTSRKLIARQAGVSKRRQWLISLHSLFDVYEFELEKLEELFHENE